MRSTICLSLIFLCSSTASLAKEPVSFSQEIRPILVDRCGNCHGADANKRKANLRIDQEKSIFSAAESGDIPVVPGKLDESALIERIKSSDESVKMPPPESAKKLTEAEIALIERWVEEGAKWEDHWAFVAPVKPRVPTVHRPDRTKNPIDNFVLHALDDLRLDSSPEADKVTLIRRVTLDLTGLPPTPAEVDVFLADQSVDAYEKLVDRLLASPRYGEHMARYWLDAVRYGDTHGLHLDNYREIWPYRDYVVSAFNKNLPYDRFITEQLAGDLLENPSIDQIVATGFNRCHVTTAEGGSITAEVEMRNVVDRVVTSTGVLMGLTFDCSRCHDHKYDPFTMNDFYSLYAFFNSLEGDPLDGNRKDHAPVISVPSVEQSQQLGLLNQQIAENEARLRAPISELDEAQAKWEQEITKPAEPEAVQKLTLGDWHYVGPFPDEQANLFKNAHGPEGKPIKLDEELTRTNAEKVSWKARPDWKDGQVHTDLPVEVAANFLYRKISSPDERTVVISVGSDDSIKIFLNEKQVHGNEVSRGVAADQEKVELKLQKGDNDLLVKIMNHGGACGFYFNLTSDVSLVPEEILVIARKPVGERTSEEKLKLLELYRFKISGDSKVAEMLAATVKLREQKGALEAQVPITLVWKEKAKPEPAYFLERGEYDRPKHERSRDVPASLPGWEEEWPKNRLGLAKWYLDRQHPLTARVAVNRLWQQFFGVGIVRTIEDFGTRGDTPSNQDLLDWLAITYQDIGWDTKNFVRLIVTSSTYRQSSKMTPETYKRDRENRLLSRGPRFRLEAEMVRDQALFLSGMLVEKQGGPGVKPPQPELWSAVAYPGSNTNFFRPDQGRDKVHRRTLYTFLKRTAPPPQMAILDGPSRESSCLRRERTNTPLQALMLFNDPQFVEASRGLAQRTLKEAPAEVEARTSHMFRICTLRNPKPDELALLVAGFHEDKAAFKTQGDLVQGLLNIGELPLLEGVPIEELAAWTMMANTLLNLDEILNKN